MKTRQLLYLIMILTVVCAVPVAAEQEKLPIIIGDINSFTSFANYTIHHKRGVDMAVDEINANGGVLKRPITIQRRDDQGRPDQAITYAQQMAADKDIVALTGFVFSHVALATSLVCNKAQIPCLATYGTSDKLLGEAWNPWMFRIGARTTMYMRAIATEVAAYPIKTLVTTAPQYEYGVNAVEIFLQELKKLRPEIKVAHQQWSPLLKLDAGPVASVLNHAKPDAIFSAHIGSDQSRLVRAGTPRGLFNDRLVIMPTIARRQDVGELLKEVPAGWLSCCHSPSQITIPAYAPFRKAYLAKYDKEPDEASVFGYSAIYAIKAAIEKAGTTDRAAVRDALEGLTWGTPLGDVTFRKFDHQSNMPFFYGKTTGDGSGLPLCNDMKQADPWAYWPRPDDELTEVLKTRMQTKGKD